MKLYPFNLDFDERQAAILFEASCAFPESVARNLDLAIQVEDLPEDIQVELSSHLSETADTLGELLNPIYLLRQNRDPSQPFSSRSNDRLCIFCSPESIAAQLMRKDNELALWGGYWPDSNIVLICHSGDGGATVWHELLHSLGAVDCYGRVDHDCNLDNCIMRYGVPREKLGPWPFLCEHNVTLVKQQAG